MRCAFEIKWFLRISLIRACWCVAAAKCDDGFEGANPAVSWNLEFETAFAGEIFYTSISRGKGGEVSYRCIKAKFHSFESFPACLDESCQKSSRRKCARNVFSLVCFFTLAPRLLFVSVECVLSRPQFGSLQI